MNFQALTPGRLITVLVAYKRAQYYYREDSKYRIFPQIKSEHLKKLDRSCCFYSVEIMKNRC